MTLSEIAKRYTWRNPGSTGWQLRKELIHKLLLNYSHPSILDIGGTNEFWLLLFDTELLGQVEITCLNLSIPDKFDKPRGNIHFIVGDARKLGHIPDKSYDIVVAHSLIEHVGGRKEQEIVARSIRRIGKSYFVQTPNFRFPIEPHFLLPGFQFAPRPLLVRIIKIFGKTGNVSHIEHVKNLNLLTKKKLLTLFPDSTLVVERAFGFVKSFIVYRA